MRLLFFTDTHLTERPPAARTSEYADDIFHKLEEIREIAATCDLSIFGGDLFHWPRPRETSHALVRRAIELFHDWPGLLRFVSGNHDQVAAGMSGYSRSPLSVVMEAMDSSAGLLHDMTYMGVHFDAAHWGADLDTDASRYQMQGVSHLDSVTSGYQVKVAHGMCMPPGEYPFNCVTMDKIQTAADLVLLGHMHWTTPPMTFNGTMFVGPGSVSRTSKSESEARRQVQVLIVNLSDRGIETEFIPLKTMRPSEDVFQWVEDRTSPTKGLLEGYVAVLESGLEVGGLSIDAVLAAMEKQAPEGVAERARQYLTDAGQ